MATIETDSRTWLDELKPGDQAVASSGWRSAGRLVTVEKVTPTQIVCGPTRYRKKDGKEIGSGGSWDRPRFLRQATQERIEAIHRHNWANKVCSIRIDDWMLLPSHELADMFHTVEDAKSAKKAAAENA